MNRRADVEDSRSFQYLRRIRISVLEEPCPEGARPSQIPFDRRPELSNLVGRDEGEDIVRLCLAHQLPDEVRPHVRIGVFQSVLELLERQVAIPEKVGPSLRIEEFLPGRRIEHGFSVAPALVWLLVEPTEERLDNLPGTGEPSASLRVVEAAAQIRECEKELHPLRDKVVSL